VQQGQMRQAQLLVVQAQQGLLLQLQTHPLLD
jgi:hypothetical protein